MTAYRKDPPPSELIEQLEYRDGFLYWKPEYLSKGRKSKPIGNLDRNGYLVFTSGVGCEEGKIRNYKVQRMIYMVCTGEWPPVVDHLDRNKLNNHISNLKASDTTNNTHNRAKRKHSQQEYVGIRKEESGKYAAIIRDNGKFCRVGGFHDAKHAALFRDVMALYTRESNTYTNFIGKKKIRINGEICA
ncbi:HNH endonuclease [Enterobacter asburiae]|uniref:HNH endonuclease n=1 Tax=Enterobacter asburiae TaxID=61645 RepID=UPI0020051F8D|nr:HNH endonuclease [Enterobacter asburiae]MCK7142563.1 HNH endonuclease [Enterobacter asburiae]